MPDAAARKPLSRRYTGIILPAKSRLWMIYGNAIIHVSPLIFYCKNNE